MDVVVHRDVREVDWEAAAMAPKVDDDRLVAEGGEVATPGVPDPGSVSCAVYEEDGWYRQEPLQ
jgi:hypothetical protein